MGTHAAIIARRRDGLWGSSYVHWDGYPSHTGVKLHQHYNTQEKVEGLLALGDLSYLDDEMTVPAGHTFATPVKGYTIAYARDDGRDLNVVADPSLITALTRYEDTYVEWVYIWRDGVWVFGAYRVATHGWSRLGNSTYVRALSTPQEAGVPPAKRSMLRRVIRYPVARQG